MRKRRIKYKPLNIQTEETPKVSVYSEVQYFSPDSRYIKIKSLVVEVPENKKMIKDECSFYCLQLTQRAHEIYHAHMNAKIDKLQVEEQVNEANGRNKKTN